MGRALTETEKKCTAVWTARFVRKAHGRITKKEAEKLARLYGRDLHWKFLRTSGDKLEGRWPMSEKWADSKKYPKQHAFWREDVTRHLAYYFAWYGPNSGYWPGDKWVFVPGEEGRCGGWRAERGNG